MQWHLRADAGADIGDGGGVRPWPAAPSLAAEPPHGCRVFLTFDVELEEDIEALRLLDPPAPCTLFITGEFAAAHPEAVREWSKLDTRSAATRCPTPT